ncbi:T6SS effector BTH_I2691 family protein [Orbus sturtevantii]|uniref:T6SS effector BTH_I2691 family protein n=1 Tax=Orbus sturtevantii TaxID=3074109 RepID=UPI00370D35DA
MASPASLLGLLAAANHNKQDNGKRCPSCQQKDGNLFVLPTRLSVAGYMTRNDIPALPNFALAQVNDLPLTHSQYCLQMLRQGYLYVLEERDTAKVWRVFTSSPEGCLTEHSDPKTVNSTPPPYTCNIALDGADASYISFTESEKIKKLYFLFSPDKILANKLEFYQAEGLALLEGMTPTEIRQGTKSLLADQFSPNILEFSVAVQLAEQAQFLNSKPSWEFSLGERDQAEKEKLKIDYVYQNRTLFYDKSINQNFARYLSLYKKMHKRQGAAIIVNDAIGITQSLNNRRHQALQQQMKPWLESKDKDGISNEYRLMILGQLDGLKQSFHDKRLQQLVNRHTQNVQAMVNYNNYNSHMADNYKAASNSALTASVEPYAQQVYQNQTREMSEKEFQDKYWRRLSQDKIDKFKQQFEQQSQLAEQLAEQRSIDFKTWLTSEPLLLALDAYDDNDKLNGIMFSLQVNACLFGTSSSPLLRDVLNGWWDSSHIARDNLCWRAYLYSNKTLIAAINQYITLQDQVTITDEPAAKFDLATTDKMVDLLDKVTEHLTQSSTIIDHLAARGLPIALLSVSFADLMRRFLAITSTGAAQLIHNRLGNTILAHINQSARELYHLKYNIGGRSFTALPSRAVPQINHVASNNYQNADLTNTRIAMIVVGFSAYDLLRKLSQGKYQTAREKAELTASIITSVAATFQIGISAIESCIGNNPSSRTAMVTYNGFGRIFLWGASLSAIAGSMTAVFDIMDMYKKIKKHEPVLTTAYFARGAATLAFSFSQFLITLGTLAPWLKGIIDRSIERTIWVKVAEFGLFLGRFALLEPVAVALGVINFYATLIIVVVSLVIIIVDDNALQKWFDRCCFSNDPEHEPYDDLTDELTEFHQAIKESF